VFDPRLPDAPCYHCLFPEGEAADEERCAITGIFAPITGMIGATQAAEALKLVAGCGESLAGRLLLLDGLAMEWRSIKVPRDLACSVCAAA
jgi:adenylyltransferase/sulfurtransferase